MWMVRIKGRILRPFILLCLGKLGEFIQLSFFVLKIITKKMLNNHFFFNDQIQYLCFRSFLARPLLPLLPLLPWEFS